MTDPPATVDPGRTAGLGETFSIAVGETVSVPAAGLSVTYAAVVSDDRCPPGQMCLVAGNATISVAVAKAAVRLPAWRSTPTAGRPPANT